LLRFRSPCYIAFQRLTNYFSLLEETENNIEKKEEPSNKRFCEPGKNGILNFTEGKNDYYCRVFALNNRFLDFAKWHFRSASGTK
jgi:hypothetical protein